MKNQIKSKNQKGITLIALVITIIVLLILAGVAINLTVGDNGIFKRAEESVEIYQNAANNEATELNTAAGEMEKLILGMSLDIQYTATSDSIIVQVNGVNATGYIFSIKKANEETYTAMPEQTEPTYTFTGLETTLYKIKIEIKTESVTLEREITVSTENLTEAERKALEENGIGEITGNEITNENLKDNEQIKAVITGNVPIPVGFSYITGTKETGVVIKNNTDKNEFVWIPTDIVEYTRTAFSRDGWKYTQSSAGIDTSTNSDIIIRADQTNYKYTETMPTDEQTSVNMYKGYFIARYESGIESETERSGAINSGKPLSQSGKHTYNYTSRNSAKQLAGTLYTKDANYITSKLCSGYAWDTALKFIDTQNPEWSVNSTGNYSGTLAKTGQSTPVCNIYDMGGNIFEWTLENCGYSHSRSVLRRRFLLVCGFRRAGRISNS